MEAQLSQNKIELEEMKEKASILDGTVIELKGILALSNEAKSLRADAAPTQKAYMSLKGLHSWNPSSINESTLAFEAVGQYVQTTNTITYTLEESSINTTVSRSNSDMKYLPKSSLSLVEYLYACVDEHSMVAHEKAAPSAAHIGSSMQYYMWRLGRLDNTVTEVQSLRRRYKTQLTRNGNKFFFSVNFQNSSTNLIAEFEIDHNYPALPLEVQLDLLKGNIELDRIRRAVKKGAKTGFGNLSRACGIIAAFVA